MIILLITRNCFKRFPLGAACRQVQFGVQAIFGPSDPLLGPHVQSICDALDIPHLETRLDLESRSAARELSINLHPSQEILNAAYKDLMRFLNWTRVAIIYEDEGGGSTVIYTSSQQQHIEATAAAENINLINPHARSSNIRSRAHSPFQQLPPSFLPA